MLFQLGLKLLKVLAEVADATFCHPDYSRVAFSLHNDVQRCFRLVDLDLKTRLARVEAGPYQRLIVQTSA